MTKKLFNRNNYLDVIEELKPESFFTLSRYRQEHQLEIYEILQLSYMDLEILFTPLKLLNDNPDEASYAKKIDSKITSHVREEKRIARNEENKKSIWYVKKEEQG